MQGLQMSKSQSRAVIEDRHEEKLKELGELLGHTSISQTVAFVLDGSLDGELSAAKAYQAKRNPKTK